MPHVSIQNLDIRIGQTDIIENLNLDVIEGEFLVLLGPSGCGKSTLLHSIAGLIDVSNGYIEIDGRDVTWADPKDRSIGMVFQSYALYPTMNVERNISFGVRVAGLPKAEIAQRVQRVAEMLQLQELLHRKPAQLSGGQRQRVAIGRALVRDASVLLFDEPLSNLDAKLRSELRRELKHLHQKLRSTMIYVTHDQVEAMTLASRIAVMRKGRLQQIDAPDVVYGKPANLFVAGFLGSPGMNFVEGQLEIAQGAPRFVSGSLTVDLSGYSFQTSPVSGLAVVLGIRPEHVAIGSDAADVGRLRANVSLVEPMGAYQLIWLDVQGKPFAVESRRGEVPQVDENVGFTFQRDKMSLFDASTQQRL